MARGLPWVKDRCQHCLFLSALLLFLSWRSNCQALPSQKVFTASVGILGILRDSRLDLSWAPCPSSYHSSFCWHPCFSKGLYREHSVKDMIQFVMERAGPFHSLKGVVSGFRFPVSGNKITSENLHTYFSFVIKATSTLMYKTNVTVCVCVQCVHKKMTAQATLLMCAMCV